MTNPGARPTVLVIGAGMYVCGRGTDGYGTVLPTLVQAQRNGEIGEIWVAAVHPESIQGLRCRLDGLNALMGTQAAVRGFPDDGAVDPQSYQKALAHLRQPACAIVVVPDHLHASIAAEVIRSGIHLLMVKPLAPTLAEALQLVDLLDAHQVYGAVDFHKRFDEANLLLRRILAEGRLGELRSILVEFSQRSTIRSSFQSWLAHTNVFQYLGVHYVDLIAFLTSARPVRVMATGQPQAAVRDGLWRLDAIQAVVEWLDDTSGRSFVSTILTNWIDPDRSPAMSTQRITVVGTQGRYESDQTYRGVRLVTDRGGVEEPNPYFSQVYPLATGERAAEGYGPRSIRQFLSDVRDLVAGNRRVSELSACRPSFQEALVSTAVIEAVAQSLLDGEQWVSIEEPGPRLSAIRGRAREGART